MKIIYSILCLSLMLLACQPKVDNSASVAFEANSKTVLAVLDGFQAESIDYASIYADDAVIAVTGFGASKDSLNLDELKASDQDNWTALDFKLLTDPVVLLPGVNADTKMAVGSVRYYGAWEVTRPATDSTEARSGVLKIYQSFDFDADGKINNQSGYGDFTGIRNYINSKEEKEEAEE